MGRRVTSLPRSSCQPLVSGLEAISKERESECGHSKERECRHLPRNLFVSHHWKKMFRQVSSSQAMLQYSIKAKVENPRGSVKNPKGAFTPPSTV